MYEGLHPSILVIMTILEIVMIIYSLGIESRSTIVEVIEKAKENTVLYLISC